MDFPVPEQPEHFVQIDVTPPPPANTALTPSFPPRQQGPNLHLQIVPHFAEGATTVAYPEVVDPSTHDGVRSPDLLACGNRRPRSQCPLDPIPQALILTAIVIGFAVLAFAAVLVKSVYRTLGTDDSDRLRETDA